MVMISDFDSDHHRHLQHPQLELHQPQNIQNPSHSPISSQLPPLSQEILNRHSHAEGASAYCVLQKLKASYPEAARGPTHRADLVSEKLLGKLSGELGRELTGPKRSRKMVSSNPWRVCQICHREFSSGRALGGHMRVHGPLFTQGTRSKKQLKSGGERHSVNFKDRRCGDDAWDMRSSEMSLSKSVAEHEEEEEESIMKALAESEEEAKDARSEQASLSSEDDLHHHDAELFSDADDDDNGVGEYSFSAGRGKEQSSLGSLYFSSKSKVAGDGDGAMESSAMVATKRNVLYPLRHKPKRSRRFADEEFAMEILATGQVAIDLSARRSASSGPEKIRVCSECGKAFWSWKALFGHMRCHPEREWRGILPPQSSEQQAARFSRKRSSAVNSFAEHSEPEFESDPENKEDAAAELEAFSKIEEEALQMKAAAKAEEEEAVLQNQIGDGQLPECISGKEKGEHRSGSVMTDDWTACWKTGKRSRRRPAGKAGSSQTSSSPEEEPALTSETVSLELGEEEQEFETPNCLFLLAEAARKIEQDTKLQLFSEVSALKGGDEGEHEDEALLPSDAREPLDEVLVATSSSGTKYECTTCKKSFNSHQALGGHRASHRKMKGCFARTNLGEETGEYSFTGEELELSSWQGPVQEKDPLHPMQKEKKKKQQQQQQMLLVKGHECSICHRIFPTGQALGGHKRCHWTGEKATETTSVASTNNQPSLVSGGQSSKLDEGGIDLNLPAPMDENDEAGYGSTELPSFHGNLVHEPEVEKKESSRIDFPATRSSLDGLSEADWTVKDLLGSGKSNSWAQAAKEEVESRFNKIWGHQQWPSDAAMA